MTLISNMAAFSKISAIANGFITFSLVIILISAIISI